MTQMLIERAWTWLHATFPERQIYIRSEGRVQFFAFSSNLQATCTGLCLIFLGWVAFASVNVVFKDRIIEAKDHRYHQMQGAYENRVADLQLSYDELNDALVSAEDRFKYTVDGLQARQHSIAGLVGQRRPNQMFALASGSGNPSSPATGSHFASFAAGRQGTTASDSLGSDSPPSANPGAGYDGSGASELGVMPQPVEPQPRTARPSQASLIGDTLYRLAAALLPVSPARGETHTALPQLAALEKQTARAAQLSNAETGLLSALDKNTTMQIEHLQRALNQAGINRAGFGRVADSGIGGPLVPLRSIGMEGISDPEFVSAYAAAIAHQTELKSLAFALAHVPLATPIRGSGFEFSSGFGPRVDPFTGRVAFHTGVDFAGPWGSPVLATAPGVVVWAGARGGYGNMVELDHGNGFHTRYGHLASIAVRTGSLVEQGSALGRLGSTGRSTGPHVHYEVWLANSVRDPVKYLDMGHELLR